MAKDKFDFNKLTLDEQRQYLRWLAENGERGKLNKLVPQVHPKLRGRTKWAWFEFN